VESHSQEESKASAQEEATIRLFLLFSNNDSIFSAKELRDGEESDTEGSQSGISQQMPPPVSATRLGASSQMVSSKSQGAKQPGSKATSSQGVKGNSAASSSSQSLKRNGSSPDPQVVKRPKPPLSQRRPQAPVQPPQPIQPPPTVESPRSHSRYALRQKKVTK
jgi:hypothetical protein